jgi:hypothetical protein
MGSCVSLQRSPGKNKSYMGYNSNRGSALRALQIRINHDWVRWGVGGTWHAVHDDSGPRVTLRDAGCIRVLPLSYKVMKLNPDEEPKDFYEITWGALMLSDKNRI